MLSMFGAGSKMNGDQRNSFEKEVDSKTVDVTESSSSEASPASIIPNLGDLTLEKDSDRKALKQDLYDLRLRIYYMEQREKLLKGDDGDDIYQKYMDLLNEHEKLLKNVDEKDDLLLKAQKVTSYLREEKEKLLFEFQEKEKFYQENVQQLEKELEDMKLCNPKFGLHSTVFMSSGDTGDSFSFPTNKDQQRVSELEHQILGLNMELESLKASNDQLEQTVHNLQRKINVCNKEITDLNSELIAVQKERDTAIENCAKNSELLNRVEKEKEKLELKLAKVEEDNENVSSSLNSAEQQFVEPSQSGSNGSAKKSDTAAAAVIRQLLTENRQMNSKLRKLKDELLYTYEMCAGCANCLKEKRLKKASVLNLRQKSAASTSEDERSDTASLRTESETELPNDNICRFKENFEIRSLLKEKDKQIKQLKAECKKRNFNLQELVNKELWDKNREIEKLNKLCEKQKHEINLLRKQADRSSAHAAMRELQPCFVRNYSEGKENISCFSDDVKMLREQLRAYLEEKKILLNKINQLETKITSDEEQKAQTSLVNNLRLEVAKHRDEFEEAEKARKDAFNACAMLTNRLEELASFLESLLAHDTSGLNSKKRELLKQAIDRSREISKSFSSTFADPENASTVGTKFESSVDLSAPILPDYSEINLSFSCGDEDDDEVGNHTLKEADEDNRNSVFNQMMRRSNDFASTEDSDSYAAKKPVLFVKDLNASGELIFSSEGVHRMDEDTNEDEAAGAEKCKVCCPSLMAVSSVPASTDEAPKTADFDSESESWSEPERQVRSGLTSTGSKLRNRRFRPEPCYSTDSDASVRAGKKGMDMNEMRQMQRRILHLERINESLRKDLKYLRTCPDKKTALEKTDVEKLREKTKLRNMLHKINLENCVDTDKYRDYVELVRRHLRDLSKYLLKSKKLDKTFVSAKLKEVSEHFEMSELCCSKLSHHLEDAKTRCDVLTGLLEETQSKFEQVMVDLHTTKLAYNSVILEHEQNIFKYKQSELANEQLNDKLKCTDEHCRAVEADLKAAKNQLSELEMKNMVDSCNCDKLKEMLDKASRRITELESFVAANDHTLEELGRCKKNVLRLTEENEKLLSDLEEVSNYRSQIEEYENQLKIYKKNCERLELELFEKDTIEKLYKEQCAKLEEEILQKSSLHNSLKLTTEELQEARTKVAELETKVNQLTDLVREKENVILEHDCRLLELKNEKESSTLLLKELKEKTENEIAEKVKTIDELGNLLKLSDDKTRKFEHEIGVLKSLLQTCEEEKREYRAKIEKQVAEYETLKKQHEQKMKHLLAQIIAYRTEEETSLAAHRQLVEQIEEAQSKKELWKKSIADWKEKYDELKKEKELIEEKLQCCKVHNSEGQARDGANSSSINTDKELMKCTMERDWFAREAELTYQLDVATMTTSHVILEWTRLANEKLRLQRELHRRDKPHYVHHLENIKAQLETRVRELEVANKQLESRLQRLQTNKVSPSDFDLTSGESSRAASPTSKKNFPFDFDYSTSKSGTTTTTGYSSSLPSSPNHVKRPLSPLTSSVPHSPVSANEDCRSIPNLWLAAENACKAPRRSIYDDVFESKTDNRLATPIRKNSSGNSATSPDLGIDSDHGRNSSFDFDTGNTEGTKIKTEIVKLEEENKTLKLELGQTRKELEETLGKLTTLNKNKRKMEKAIYKQIYETRHIIQKARVNLEDDNADNNANAS